jgi:hypothetical protein
MPFAGSIQAQEKAAFAFQNPMQNKPALPNHGYDMSRLSSREVKTQIKSVTSTKTSLAPGLRLKRIMAHAGHHFMKWAPAAAPAVLSTLPQLQQVI